MHAPGVTLGDLAVTLRAAGIAHQAIGGDGSLGADPREGRRVGRDQLRRRAAGQVQAECQGREGERGAGPPSTRAPVERRARQAVDDEEPGDGERREDVDPVRDGAHAGVVDLEEPEAGEQQP